MRKRRLYLCCVLVTIALAACAVSQPKETPSPAVSPVVDGVALNSDTPALPEPYLGIWIGRDELEQLPMDGPAWQQLKEVANQPADAPNVGDQNQMNDVQVLAKALVYARTGDLTYRRQVVDNLMAAIGTEAGSTTLALGRNLVSYVIAADLIDLPSDEEQDQQFRIWLRAVLTEELDGRTLQSTHEERPNNWGTHAGAARVAVARYLQDADELERTAQVFRGYLGDRDAYAGFKYGRLDWQADPERPVGVNPPGAVKDGYPIGGALPEEMRRPGRFSWPPQRTQYAWEALQGALVQAELLHRAGYSAWEWEDQALRRAAQFLYDLAWEPRGDDEWQPWLINYAYGANYPTTTPANPGKNMGWTDWTHNSIHHLPIYLPTISK